MCDICGINSITKSKNTISDDFRNINKFDMEIDDIGIKIYKNCEDCQKVICEYCLNSDYDFTSCSICAEIYCMDCCSNNVKKEKVDDRNNSKHNSRQINMRTCEKCRNTCCYKHYFNYDDYRKYDLCFCDNCTGLTKKQMDIKELHKSIRYGQKMFIEKYIIPDLANIVAEYLSDKNI